MKGFAYVFVNYWQAAQLGHLGWGFMLEPNMYYFGSTDHLLRTPYWNLPALFRYMHAARGANIDWWAKTGTLEEMLLDMRDGHHVRYQAYKIIKVTEAEPLNARQTAQETATGGWAVLANNCLHQTHRILHAYGAGSMVPDPKRPVLRSKIPRLWFDSIQAERTWLD